MQPAGQILIACIALLLAVWLVVRWRKKQQTNRVDSAPSQPVHPYAAVKIKPIKHHSCEAAYEASCRIFLKSEAPFLPLRDCGRPNQCRCSYVHYNDRRQGSRRSPNVYTDGLKLEGYPLHREKRDKKKRGRRKTDH